MKPFIHLSIQKSKFLLDKYNTKTLKLKELTLFYFFVKVLELTNNKSLYQSFLPI